MYMGSTHGVSGSNIQLDSSGADRGSTFHRNLLLLECISGKDSENYPKRCLACFVKTGLVILQPEPGTCIFKFLFKNRVKCVLFTVKCCLAFQENMTMCLAELGLKNLLDLFFN